MPEISFVDIWLCSIIDLFYAFIYLNLYFILPVLPFGLFQSLNDFSLHPSAGLVSLMTSWNMRWIRTWTTGGAQHNFFRWIDMPHLYFKTYNLRPHPHKHDLTRVRLAAVSQRKSPLFTSPWSAALGGLSCHMNQQLFIYKFVCVRHFLH